MLTEYFESGSFEREYDETIRMILPYVEKDPTAFFTPEEFKSGSACLSDFVHCGRRASANSWMGHFLQTAQNKRQKTKSRHPI